MTQPRKPRGVPSGGQFANKAHSESTGTLSASPSSRDEILDALGTYRHDDVLGPDELAEILGRRVNATVGATRLASFIGNYPGDRVDPNAIVALSRAGSGVFGGDLGSRVDDEAYDTVRETTGLGRWLHDDGPGRGIDWDHTGVSFSATGQLNEVDTDYLPSDLGQQVTQASAADPGRKVRFHMSDGGATPVSIKLSDEERNGVVTQITADHDPGVTPSQATDIVHRWDAGEGMEAWERSAVHSALPPVARISLTAAVRLREHIDDAFVGQYRFIGSDEDLQDRYEMALDEYRYAADA